MKLLHVIATVNPAYGGPVEALMQSQPVWLRLGHHRTVASLDLPDDPWVAACPIPTVALGSRFARRWRSRVALLRYGFAPRLLPWLRRHAPDFDAVVVHGLWHYAALAARLVLPRLRQPYFVFTHGMLDPWFRQAHPMKHRFKQMSWWLCEGPLLARAKAVLFTSERERSKAENGFRPYRLRARVAGYGVAEPPSRPETPDGTLEARLPALGRRPFLLFLGRIHPKKGCDLLIEAFAASAPRDLDLVIAGPETAWTADLQALADRLGVADRIHWPGHLQGSAKWSALHGCAAFVLPSHGENFGLAIAEALACGRLVLISDKVDIGEAVLAAGAGLVGSDTRTGTTDLLRRFLGLTEPERRAMGRQARACFIGNFHIDRTVGRTLAILEGTES